MPKSKSSTIDKARQALGRAVLSSAKNAKKSITKKAKLVQRNRDKETLARWRALNKLGVTKTKNNPALKNITPHISKKINLAYHDIMNAGHYSSGKVQRPLTRKIKKSPKGKERIVYDLNDTYKFLRTKKKTNARSGIIPTGKGYIVEKQNSNSKISIKNGQIIEKIGKIRIKKSGYVGNEIITLRDNIEDGKIKIRDNEYLVYRPWGSQRVEQMFANDSLDDFVQMVDEYKTQMPPKIFNSWLDRTEVVFITEGK